MDTRSCELIALYRRRAGLTFKNVAAAVGRSDVWVHYIEHGQLTPTSGDVNRLSVALGQDLTRLFSNARDVRGSRHEPRAR